jgi:DNA-binding NarL/FixJ family response regulator
VHPRPRHSNAGTRAGGGARVLIADKDAPTRAGVRIALEAGGFEICAEAATASEAVSGALRDRPDICLLEVSMPGNGIDAARTITDKLPATAVVMLTGSGDDDDLFAALRAGARGYLSKEIDPHRLFQALEGVLEGEAALSPRLVARLVQEFRAEGGRRKDTLPVGRPATLTDREWEVLRLLKDGLSTAEIAERLFVAPVTVRTHIRAIVRKLRVADRAAAVRLLER